MEPESLVSVPLLVEDRVVAVLNVYRIGVDKTFSDAEVAQVERFATMAALAFDSARQRDTLREQARTDGLTGLLNHRACHERLGEEIVRAAALERPLSVVVLDLDHFKTVNDAYGHAEGDKVLVAAAAKLRSAVREDDLVARLGGEEFALILPGVDGDAAPREAAERARAAIAEVGVGGAPLSCSAGVADLPRRRARRRRGCSSSPTARCTGPSARAATRAGATTAGSPASSPATASGPRSRRCSRARTRSCRSSSRCSSSPRAASPATRRSRGCPTGRSGRPTSGSTRRIAPGSGPRSRRPRCAPRCARAAGRSGRSSRVNVSPGALLVARGARRAARRPVRHRDRAHRARAVLDRGRARPRARPSCASAARGSRSTTPATATPGCSRSSAIAPDILKLDRSLVDGVHDDPHRFALLEALISFASTTRAAVCAEGVETLDDLAVLAAMDVTYAQGWALARPDAPWAAAVARRPRPRRRPRCGSACASRASRTTTRRRRSAT